MKKILLSLAIVALINAVVVNPAQAMNNSEKPTVLKKAGNIATEFAGTIVKFTYDHPYLAAILATPLVPNKMAPFRRLYLQVIQEGNRSIVDESVLLAGLAVRANLLNILSHTYLKQNDLEHQPNNGASLITKCSCTPKK
ncbi:hypothetical protein M1466_03980 [Candidatus Dependentiae bacterium]|nr:hypothetical protein [Candidatus Dependentiae bacterium]